MLSNITFALRPIYKLAVEAGGCEKARDHFKGEDVECASASSFEMVHHVKANMGYYLQGDVMMGMDEESMMKLIKWVEEARVDLVNPEEVRPLCAASLFPVSAFISQCNSPDATPESSTVFIMVLTLVVAVKIMVVVMALMRMYMTYYWRC